MPKPHRILIATDGSPSAQAALQTAVRVPWPASARARALVARTSWLPADADWLTDPAEARAALEKTFEPVVDAARRTLATRWPNSNILIVDAAPRDAIPGEAARFKASLIVLGWRGHGAFRRLLAGSVSRSVAAKAECALLVVRVAPKAVRRIVLAFDGCPFAERALEFLASLEPRRGSRVVLVNVVEPAHMPHSLARFPSSIRAPLRRQYTELKHRRQAMAQTLLDAAAARLKSAGWSVQTEVRIGDPLTNLLDAVKQHHADLLVLGARASAGLEHALLGSVAAGALDRSPVAVLLAR